MTMGLIVVSVVILLTLFVGLMMRNKEMIVSPLCGRWHWMVNGKRELFANYRGYDKRREGWKLHGS